MRRILSTLLIVVLLLGNICYAQTSKTDIDRNTYFVSTNTDQYVSRGLNNPQEYRRDRHNRHDRDRRDRRHHRRHDHDDHVDAGDIIAGIIIYEVVKEILD